MLESYYQRFNVNMIGLTYDSFVREMNSILCGPTILWMGIGK